MAALTSKARQVCFFECRVLSVHCFGSGSYPSAWSGTPDSNMYKRLDISTKFIHCVPLDPLSQAPVFSSTMQDCLAGWLAYFSEPGSHIRVGTNNSISSSGTSE